MPDINAQLESLGIDLPDAPAPVASYVPVASVHSGNLVLVSGQIPTENGSPMATGRVPDRVDLDTAARCARRCALNALAALRHDIGDLNRVRRVLKLDGFVAAGPDFTDHPRVINGASDLLVEIFGDSGRHARAAVGVSSLPLGVPVEIAFTFITD